MLKAKRKNGPTARGVSVQLERRVIVVGGLLMLAVAAPAIAQTQVPGGGDIFGGIVNLVGNNMGKWSGALIASGMLSLGWEFMRGSSQSGERMKSVLIGSVILIVTGTAGGVIALLETVRRYAGPQ